MDTQTGRNNHLASWRLAAGLGFTLLLNACGMADSLQKSNGLTQLPFPLRSLNAATSNLTIHPFAANTSRGFNLFSSGQISFSQAVQSLVSDQLGNGIQLQLNKADLSSQLTAGGDRYDGAFFLNGVPILGTHMSANMLSDRTPFILGTVPNVSALAAANAPTSWPDVEAVKAKVLVNLSLPDSAATVGYPSRSYLPAQDGELHAVWKMTAHLKNLPYDVVADDSGVISMTKRYFEADGSANVYPKNVNDPATTNYALHDLTGDGTMTSIYLQTYMDAPFARAVATNELFNYPSSDSRFAEANAFAHTDEHFRWMQSIGGKTYGDLPIHLLLHQTPNDTPNNALFIPGDTESGEPFQILLGDGDGTTLANLPTDWDVPSHESGHYFVYNFLKATTDESLGVHEGMADLLVFLQKGIKGDPQAACLGESICPAGTQACISSTCLRTGDNNWAYNDVNWQAWTAQLYPPVCCGHKHGQVLSGVVWDMVKNNVMSAADAASLTFTAISYFKGDSGIRDYLLSLLIADKTVFACKYDSQIRKFMSNRNLTTLISDAAPGCSNIPALTGTGNDSLVGSSGGAASSSGSRSKGGVLGTGCGTIGADSNVQPWVILILALLPIVTAVAFPKLVRVPVKSRQTRRKKR